MVFFLQVYMLIFWNLWLSITILKWFLIVVLFLSLNFWKNKLENKVGVAEPGFLSLNSLGNFITSGQCWKGRKTSLDFSHSSLHRMRCTNLFVLLVSLHLRYLFILFVSQRKEANYLLSILIIRANLKIILIFWVVGKKCQNIF